MCIWRQCNKDPSAALGMTVLGERIGSQGWCATFLEDGILASSAFPIGEGARRADRVLSYERQMGKVERRQHIGGKTVSPSPRMTKISRFAQNDDTGVS